MPTLYLLVKGVVQGVNYRASAWDQAQRLALTGWVRNTPDGHVEITATGDDAALQAFTSWCRRGPTMAHVTDVQTKALPETPFPDFSIRRG